MDLIVGKDGYGVLLVLAERGTSYCILEKLPHGKMPRRLQRPLSVCCTPIGLPEFWQLPRITAVSSRLTNWEPKGQRYNRLFCRFLLLMAERPDRVYQQTYPAIYSKMNWFLDCYGCVYQENTDKTKSKATGETNYFQPQQLSFSNIFAYIAFALGLCKSTFLL